MHTSLYAPSLITRDRRVDLTPPLDQEGPLITFVTKISRELLTYPRLQR